MECKDIPEPTVKFCEQVLIETLWNVKNQVSINTTTTLASINRNIVECKDYTTQGDIREGPRINRNIVECKGRSKRATTHAAGVLIETLWNVKLLARINFVSVQYRINRNIVECKDVKPSSFRISRIRY